MAEERPGGEPTEPPSEKRLRQARERGEVARSRELTSAVVFIAVAATVAWTWPRLLAQLRAGLGAGLRAAAEGGGPSPTAALEGGLRSLALAAWPILLAAFCAAAIGSFAQVGALFTLHPLKPSLRKLDPTKNLGQIFGKAAWVEIAKTLIKVVGIGWVAAGALRDRLPAVLATVGGASTAPETWLAPLADCLGTIAIRVGILVAALAALDLLYQRRSWLKRMRMTRVEVQREQKESEGDPQHKAERRRVHQEILEHQALEQVATADCVIINPEHVAVAIRYDAESMDAPRVLARGRRLLAARIREIARQKGIPVVRNVPLARALVELELDQEIPAELYEAVAEVLRFVYALAERGRAAAPPALSQPPPGRRV
jgi:flagellar biosynthetic protein FlhB